MGSPDRPQVILPAAGFGRRLGSPQSKEVLPLRDGQPLINLALDMCLQRQWPVSLVTRPEKVSLLQHMSEYESKGLELSVVEVGATQEWPDSVLKSEGHWREWNLVVLPDTEFQPRRIWDEMWSLAKGPLDLVVAQHGVEDSENWGVLKPTESGVKVGEKQPGENQAWGLYMFRQKWGAAVLTAQLQSQKESKWIEIEGCRTGTLPLDLFQDLTRGE